MENSILVPWLKCAFAGRPKMLIGKKFPMNVRALRFTVLDLIKGFVDNVISFDELHGKFDNISQKNILTQLWMKNLCLPVFLMFIRAEQGGFPLPLMHARLHLFKTMSKLITFEINS